MRVAASVTLFTLIVMSSRAAAMDNLPIAECPADLTGDEAVDIEDLLRVVLAWGPCPECIEDVDDDGEVAVGDLLEVLLGWGPCGCQEHARLVDFGSNTSWSPQEGYELGSHRNLRLLLECLEPDNVVFQVWSAGVHGAFTDWTAPFIYDGDALVPGAVPAGPGFLQAILRDAGNTPFLLIEFPTIFYPPTSRPPCDDGIDNDGDGLADFPADPGCTWTGDTSEVDPDGGSAGPWLPPEPGAGSCGDGVCEPGENASTCPQDCSAHPDAVLLWSEDFELQTYERWGWPYEDWSDCAMNGFTEERSVSGIAAHRSQVTCPAPSSHRGYGLLRFIGDETVPTFFVPSDGGIDAPHGIVVRFHGWLDAAEEFSVPSGRWVSFMTVTDDCSNAWQGVLTVNIDDPSNRLKPVHVDTVEYAANAPAFPLRQWVRTTVYVNFHDEVMHIWQDGEPVALATFTRPGETACQLHFGLYASGANDDLELYEDDIEIWRLNQPLAGFEIEPLSP